MSTKALKRELAAAIAMLLVAMIALSGSTYAWFAQNNKVTAESVTVHASSPDPYLQISNDGGSSWKTEVLDMTTTTSTIKLVAPTGAAVQASMAWYTTISDDPTVAVTAESAKHITDVTDGDAEYMVKVPLKLRNASGVDATQLKVAATIAGITSDNLDKAIRTLVVIQDGTAAATFDSAATAPVEIMTTLAANAVKNVDVYVYYDGTDAHATNEKAIDLQDLTVGLTFTIDQ